MQFSLSPILTGYLPAFIFVQLVGLLYHYRALILGPFSYVVFPFTIFLCNKDSGTLGKPITNTIAVPRPVIQPPQIVIHPPDTTIKDALLKIMKRKNGAWKKYALNRITLFRRLKKEDNPIFNVKLLIAAFGVQKVTKETANPESTFSTTLTKLRESDILVHTSEQNYQISPNALSNWDVVEAYVAP